MVRALIACEFSGTVRDAFRSLGHDAWSCDILPTTADPAFHIQADVLTVLDDGWDLMIAFPPCQYLSRAASRLWDAPGREANRQDALDFVRKLMNAPIPKIAIENPAGAIGTNIRKADQYIQPYQFGDPYKKQTGLWLKNLPLLKPTNIVTPLSDWTEAHRSVKIRSQTFPGVASAMSAQWGLEHATRHF